MLVPAGHRVLVKPDTVEEVTKGGIILTATVKEKDELAGIFGTVVAVGDTAWKDYSSGEPWAKVGDRVAFAKYGGFIIADPATDEQFRLLNDEDIVAVIR